MKNCIDALLEPVLFAVTAALFGFSLLADVAGKQPEAAQAGQTSQQLAQAASTGVRHG